jgi:tRNA (guanine-N(7)-)-methyltransferase subunit TRM82
VPAIFYLELTKQNCIIHSQTIILPGNPLDIAVVSRSGVIDKVIAAVDVTDPDADDSQTKGLVVLKWDNHALTVQPIFTFLDSALEDTDTGVSREEVMKLLYNVETLRKQGLEAEEFDAEVQLNMVE